MVDPEKERRAFLAARIQQLTASLDWDAFAKEVIQIEQSVLESLASATREEFQYTQGVLHGIRRIKGLPQILIGQGRRL